jgi:two-component system sensor histidine kinase QseC
MAWTRLFRRQPRVSERVAEPVPVSASKGAYSLRRRLIITILGSSVLLWMVCLGLVVHVAWKETSDVFDDALKESARLTLVLGDRLARSGALVEADASAGEPAKLKLYYQLVAHDGQVLRRASKAPTQAFLPAIDKAKGFHRNVFLEGEPWRVYVLPSGDGQFSAQVGQPWSERTELLAEMAEDLAVPGLCLLLLLALVCWFAIRQVLKPLGDTAHRVALKSPRDLSPVPSDSDPRELQPIVGALNAVLGRLSHALDAERRFTADAAHELRTPLAALRGRIQLLQRRGNAASAELQPLRDDVDRCTRLVENLLILARMDPERPDTLVREQQPLAPLLQRLRDELALLPGEAAPSLQIEGHADSIHAHPSLLHGALRNLLENAAHHGRGGQGTVRIVLKVERLGDKGVRTSVLDDGPGVAPIMRERLSERFFRVLSSEAAEGKPDGSGLGLSIVARTVELHGGRLFFEDGLERPATADGRTHGLAVVIDWPA